MEETDKKSFAEDRKNQGDRRSTAQIHLAEPNECSKLRRSFIAPQGDFL